MPNRLIREGFLDSESIAALSESAECFYHRLLLVVDDAGRTDGRPGLLRGRLYPLGTERSVGEILRLLHECEAHGLLHYYTYDDKPYIQLARWQRPGNSLYSKFPWRDGTHRVTWTKRETRDGTKEFCTTSLHAGDSQAPLPGAVFLRPHPDGIEGHFRHISEDGDGDEHEDALSHRQRSAGPVSGRADPRPPRAAGGKGGEGGPFIVSGGDAPSQPWAARRGDVSGREVLAGPSAQADETGRSKAAGAKCAGAAFQEFWQAYPKKRGRDAAHRVWMQKRPPLPQCLAAIEKLRRTEEWRKDGGQFIPHPANWLAAGGWNDVPEVDLRRSQNATSGKSPLLPGESPPKPLRDPEVWPDYVAQHPEFAGKHLRDLSAVEQEAFKDWSFARQREEWQKMRK